MASFVTNVSAIATSTTAGSVQHVRYTFSFTATSALGPTGTITIDAPTGTVLPSFAALHDDTANTSFSRSGTRTNSNRTLTLDLCCSDTINPGDTVTVTLDDVTNAAAGVQTLAVSTSADTTPVNSPSYTLVAQQQISGLTTPTLSSTAGGVQHVSYSFSFTASSIGGLVGPGTITIAAPAGTVLPTFGQVRDDTTSTTLSRSGVRTNSNATLTLSLCCSDQISAGDTITVTLDDVKNPATGGPYSLSLSTSSDPSPVTTPQYSLTAPEQITNLTAASLSSAASGVQHVSYSFSFKASGSTGRLVDPGTITIAAPGGTVLPTFGVIRDDTSGITMSRSGVRTNSNATLTLSLCCSDQINPGDTITVTLDDVTNPGPGGHTLDVSTSSNPTPVTTPTYTLTAPEQITGLTGVSLSSAAGGVQHVRYSFSFKASGSTGRLVDPGTITISAEPGTVMPTFGEIRDDTAGTTMSRSGVRTNSNATLTLSLCCSDAINPGDTVTVTLDDVTNPATGGPYALNVATSSNPASVTTPGFTLTAPQQVTGLTAVTATTDAQGVVSDTFSFKPSVPTGGLVSSGEITIAAPAGTVLPTFAEISDDTANTQGSRSGVRSNSNATLTLSLCCSDALNPGDTIMVTLRDVTNPPGGPGPFDVSTSSDTVAAQTPPPGPPPPVIGQKATAAVEKGVVRVKLPGSKGFVTLTQTRSIPLGSTLDTTKGQVALTFATNAAGTSTQRGSFSQGQFRALQSKKNPLTTLSMVGGGMNACKAKLPKGGAPKQASAARKRRRTLFSNVHGRFQTRGRNSTATVRGTQWRVTDICSGTTTKVTRGSVLVRDLTLKRNVLVKAGHSYLARAPLVKKHH